MSLKKSINQRGFTWCLTARASGFSVSDNLTRSSSFFFFKCGLNGMATPLYNDQTFVIYAIMWLHTRSNNNNNSNNFYKQQKKVLLLLQLCFIFLSPPSGGWRQHSPAEQLPCHLPAECAVYWEISWKRDSTITSHIWRSKKKITPTTLYMIRMFVHAH